MQLRRLMIFLTICIVGLVIAALGMYHSWQDFKSGGIWGTIDLKRALLHGGWYE